MRCRFLSPVLLTAVLTAALGIPPARAQDKPTYDDHIKPLFREHCLTCHNPDTSKGGLDLSGYRGVLTGGSSGEVVQPGDPEGSTLFRVTAHLQEPFMPQRAGKRPDAELELLRRWIAGGLLEYTGSKAQVSKQPKLDLALDADVAGQRPEGPPPMPEDLALEPVVVPPRADAAVALAASPWAPLAAVGGQRQVLLYHADTGRLAGVLPFEEGRPYQVRFSGNGRLVMAGGGVGAKLGTVVLWDVTTGERVAQVGEEYDAVMAADLSPDQRWVAVGGTDKMVRIYATSGGDPVHRIKKHTEWVTAVGFSPDGVLLATGDRNGGLMVWEAQSGQEFYRLDGHPQAVTGLAWRRDANVLASCSEDGTIKLWDLHSGKQAKSWTAHPGGALAVAFAPDGRLVSGGRDRRCKIWAADGNLQKEITDFQDIVLGVAFGHDSSWVAAGDWTGRIRLFDAAEGSPRVELAANPPSIETRLAEVRARLLEREAPHAAGKTEADQARAAYSALRARQRKRDRIAETAGGIRDLYTRLAEAGQQAVQGRGEALQQVRNELEGLDRALQAAQKEQADTEAAQRALASEMGACEQQLVEQRQRLGELEAALQLARTQATENTTDPALAETAAQAGTEAGRARDGLAELEQQLSERRGQEEKLQTRLRDQRQSVQDLQARRPGLAQQVTPLETARQQEQAALDRVRQDLQQAGVAREEAVQSAAADRDQVETARTRAEEASAREADLHAALPAVRAEQLFWEAAEFNLQVRSARRERRDTAQVYTGLREEAAAAAQAADQMLRQLTDLRKTEWSRLEQAPPGEAAPGLDAFQQRMNELVDQFRGQTQSEHAALSAAGAAGAAFAERDAAYTQLKTRYEALKAAQP